MAKWAHLMDLLEKKRRILNGFNDMLEMFRQIESTAIELKDMEVTIFVQLRLPSANETFMAVHLSLLRAFEGLILPIAVYIVTFF